MAVLRERPYVQFNFLVDLGTGNTEGPEAGFQEVSGIGMEVTVAEYRNGNEKENCVRKVTGMNKSTDVTLKRGVIGAVTDGRVVEDGSLVDAVVADLRERVEAEVSTRAA